MRPIEYLVQLFFTGFFAFLGLTLGLHTYGLIDGWSVFDGDGWLFEQWKHPWYALGSTAWFGIAILIFRKGS